MALSLIARIKKVVDNITEVQLLLAKITGNFKRGNEKFGKNKLSLYFVVRKQCWMV